MKPLIVILLLLIAGLCFYAGYELGKPNLVGVQEPAPAADTEEQKDPEKTKAEPVDTEQLPPLPARQELEVPSEAGLAARAGLRYITLIDEQGRDMVAEVLGPGAGGLRVRRQTDYRIVDIPLPMLSREDRIFAEYILKSEEPEAASAQTADRQKPERGPDITEDALVELIRDQFNDSRFR
jgi:hypothetical protein